VKTNVIDVKVLKTGRLALDRLSGGLDEKSPFSRIFPGVIWMLVIGKENHMNEKLENVKESAKDFGQRAKDEAKRIGAQTTAFVQRNKELIVVCVPVAIAAIKSGQSLIVNRRVAKERDRIEHTFYDPRTGFHWELKRKPSNADRAEIIRRREGGQDMYRILKEMNLIK
jgi:hypothetical protein